MTNKSTKVKETLYYHSDLVGTTSVVTNQTGDVVSTTDSQAFGVVRNTLSTRGDTDTYYGTHRKDVGSRIILTPERGYDPVINRFLSLDPAALYTAERFVGDPQSLNLYSYANNNPVIFNDPTGESIGDSFIGISNAFISNQAFGAGRIDSRYYNGDTVDFATGQMIGDALAIISSNAEIIYGAGIGTAGSVATFASGGIAAVASVPIAVAGAALMTHGIGVAGTSGYYLSESLRGSRNPNTQNKALEGIKAHKNYDFGEGFEKEYRFQNGLRADAIDLKNKIIKELKPDNPTAISRGLKQLQKYIEQANKELGGAFKGKLETYSNKK